MTKLDAVLKSATVVAHMQALSRCREHYHALLLADYWFI